MNRRKELNKILQNSIEGGHVYFQPPENIKMEYPCIRYSVDSIDKLHADNTAYNKTVRYQIIVIDRKPNNNAIEKILDLPMSSFNRHYISDNLNHDVIILYY